MVLYDVFFTIILSYKENIYKTNCSFWAGAQKWKPLDFVENNNNNFNQNEFSWIKKIKKSCKIIMNYLKNNFEYLPKIIKNELNLIFTKLHE